MTGSCSHCIEQQPVALRHAPIPSSLQGVTSPWDRVDRLCQACHFWISLKCEKPTTRTCMIWQLVLIFRLWRRAWQVASKHTLQDIKPCAFVHKPNRQHRVVIPLDFSVGQRRSQPVTFHSTREQGIIWTRNMWICYDVVCLFQLALLTSWEAAHTCKSQWHGHISEALRWLERWQRMRPPTRPLCLSLSLSLSLLLSFLFLSLSLYLCVWVGHAPRIWGQPTSPRESVAEFKCHVFFSNEQHAWCIARMTDERIPISRASCSCNILTCHLWGPLLRYVRNFPSLECLCVYPLSQNDYRQEKIIFGGSTGKSCKSPGGYYIIKFLGNYFSHPVRAPSLCNLCGSGTETGGGALTGQGLLQEKMFGELFSGALHKNPAIAPGQLH